MLKRFFWVVICSVIFIWKIHAQEVIVGAVTDPSFGKLVNLLKQFDDDDRDGGEFDR